MAIVPNSQQEAASRALRGKVLISAGAGSGKTRTLVARFVNALEVNDAERWDPAPVDGVLAITFTEKAAGEIAERVRSVLRQSGRLAQSREVDSAWIGTIHSFCSRVLRRYALEAGIDPSFSVAEQVDAERLREQAFEQACIQTGHDGRSALLGDYEFDDVYSAVRGLAEFVRTNAVALPDVEVEPATRAHELLVDAVGVLSAGRDAVRACGDERAQATKLLDGCCLACEQLAGIDCATLSESDTAFEVWKALTRFRPSGSAASIKGIAAELADHRQRLIGRAVAAVVEAHATALVELAAAYDAAYRDLKAKRGLLDFDDLQIEALRLLSSNDDVLGEIKRQFRMVMVDEFQDTDELQLALLSSVAGENLCTVGDEQQSIYGFRGAAVDVYRRHNEAMRSGESREYQLSLNYRSHPAVLDFVNHVFGGLFGGSLIRLEAGREEVAPLLPAEEPRVELTLVRASSGGDGRTAEARQVAERLAALRDSHSVDPGDMVVLLRSYTHADAYASALSHKGFSVSIVGGSRFFEVPSVVLGRALIAAIVNPHDDEALAVLLASPEIGLSDDGLWSLGRASTAAGGTLWEALASGPVGASEDDRRRLERLRRVIENARTRVGGCRLSELILRAAEELEYDLALLSAGEEGRAGFANLLKLASMADAFEHAGGAGPAAFATYLNAKEQYRDHTVPASLADQHGSTVRIMSIHASKGLEFPVVAMPELGAGGRNDGPIAAWRREDRRLTLAMRLPSELSAGAATEARYSELYKRIRDEGKLADLDEAQRLFYVGCTRAREVLVLSGSGSFAEAPKDTSSLPVDWLRTGLDLCNHADGIDEVRTSGGATYQLRTIDAAPLDKATTEPPVQPAPTRSDLVATKCVTPAASETRDPGVVLPDRMSYSDFSLYESCAKRFWAEKVMRVGRIRPPSGAADPFRLGSAVHAALELAPSAVPDEARVLALARAFDLEGSEVTALHSAIVAYVDSKVAADLESHDVVRREWPFALPVPTDQGDFTLVGSVDAYGRSGHRGLVVDYKTGRSGEFAELSERYALQASIYALAALHDGCTDVRVVFVRPQALDEKGRPQQVGFAFGVADAAVIEHALAARFERLAAEGFPALESWAPATCGDCPIAGGVCTVRPGEGWRLAKCL